MYIVVASGNIFRRELTSYILSEAGHEMAEVRTSGDLMGALRSRQPALIVLDQQLGCADPGATLRAVRLLSDAPILWIADPMRSHPPPMADEGPSEMIGWPFRGDDLLAAAAALCGRAGATLSAPRGEGRFARSAE